MKNKKITPYPENQAEPSTITDQLASGDCWIKSRIIGSFMHQSKLNPVYLEKSKFT